MAQNKDHVQSKRRPISNSQAHIKIQNKDDTSNEVTCFSSQAPRFLTSEILTSHSASQTHGESNMNEGRFCRFVWLGNTAERCTDFISVLSCLLFIICTPWAPPASICVSYFSGFDKVSYGLQNAMHGQHILHFLCSLGDATLVYIVVCSVR